MRTIARRQPRLRLATFYCIIAALMTGCGTPQPILTQQVEARHLAADLRIQFTKAAEAANRSVMAETDEASREAAGEAQEATTAVEHAVQSLQPVLNSLGYPDEIRLLGEFSKAFAEYRTLDDTILGLAVENTNLKAQRLSFGPVREAADAFRDSLEGVAKAVPSKDVDALVARAVLAVRDVQVIQAQHIAEPDDAVMSRLEAQMAASLSSARTTLGTLTDHVPPASTGAIANARNALDRFQAVHTELIGLSRRNSNVRSLALTLGRKRMLTATCDDMLQALQDALAKHEFKATR